MTRSPGSRAGLTLPAIVEAASGLAPEDVDLQAVADLLGVDRTSVRHHVRSREALLQLLAVRAFAESFSKVRVPRGKGWEAACRRFATGFVDCLSGTGMLADHFGDSDLLVTGVLRPTEALAAELLAAGMAEETVVRTITLLAAICIGFVRDASSAARDSRPRMTFVRAALATDPSRFDTLRRLAARNVDTYSRRQFEFEVDVVLAGLRATGRLDGDPRS